MSMPAMGSCEQVELGQQAKSQKTPHGNYLQAGLWFHIFQRCVNPKIDSNKLTPNSP